MILDEWTSFSEVDGLHPDISSLEIGRNGLWIGTNGGGAYLYAEGRLEALDAATGFFVTSLLEDRDGSLWIGTQDSGLYRLHPGADEPMDLDVVWLKFVFCKSRACRSHPTCTPFNHEKSQ